MKCHVNAENLAEQADHSIGPLVYFLTTTWIIFVLISPIVAVGCLLGRLYRPIFVFSRYCMMKCTNMMMAIQYWGKFDFAIHELKSERPVIYISNHRSHIDVFMLMTRFATLRVLAKQRLLFVPFLGPIMWLTRQIFVGETAKSLQEVGVKVKNAALDGDSVLIFPEHTRSPAGNTGTLPFRLSAFQWAKEVDAIIVPVTVKGTDQAWPKGVVGIQQGHEMSVKTLPPVDTRSFSKLKELKDFVRSQIERELVKP